MYYVDEDESGNDVRGGAVAAPIPIAKDSDGYPELPTITAGDGHRTKVVQSMLRDYCTTHIRELFI